MAKSLSEVLRRFLTVMLMVVAIVAIGAHIVQEYEITNAVVGTVIVIFLAAGVVWWWKKNVH